MASEPKRMIKNRFREHLAVKARREGRKRITHDDLVSETGISRQTISSYLNNTAQRYSIRVVSVLCEYLSVGPEQFFAWDDIDDKESEDHTEERTLLAIPA